MLVGGLRGLRCPCHTLCEEISSKFKSWSRFIIWRAQARRSEGMFTGCLISTTFNELRKQTIAAEPYAPQAKDSVGVWWIVCTFLMIPVWCCWDHICEMESRSKGPLTSPNPTRFNMRSEPYSSLEITESVKWNKVNCWLGPLSFCPCLKSLSTPAEFRIHCPETRSNLAAIDPFPNQTQDLLDMLTTSEWVF